MKVKVLYEDHSHLNLTSIPYTDSLLSALMAWNDTLTEVLHVFRNYFFFL